MTNNPEQPLGVGEDVPRAINEKARRDAKFQLAVSDLLYLAEHGNTELLRAVRDLNIQATTPDSYRHAHDVQAIRHTLLHLLATLGLEQAIIPEQRTEINTQTRKSRPPIVDVELP